MAASNSNSSGPAFASGSIVGAVVVFALIALGVGWGLWRTGYLAPRVVTDSSSYTEFEFFPVADAMRAQRTAGYPAFLAAVDLFGDWRLHAALAHWLVHVLACGVFSYGLFAIWKSPYGCVYAGASMLFANIIYRYVDNVTPDVLAVSIAIATVGCALRFSQSRGLVSFVLVTLGVFVCCQLRPAYLFMVPFVPLVVVGLRWIAGESVRNAGRSGGAMLLACTTPTLAYCCVRYLMVGYLGIVSFGGNNLAGVMTAFLDEAAVEALPENARTLGAAVLVERDEYSEKHPEFPSGVVTGYSAIEEQFDDSTWRICVPTALRRTGGDWPEANQAMMELGVGVIQTQPSRYGMWLFKAARRAAQIAVAEFVGNPVYLMLLLALSASALLRLYSQRRAGEAIQHSEDRVLQSLVWIALLFLLAKTSLVILTSPPLGRFMDAAAVFLPTVAVYLLLREWRWITTLRRAAN